MVSVYKKDNLIFFTDLPEKKIKSGEVLYTFSGWNLARVLEVFRPWKELSFDTEGFKESVLGSDLFREDIEYYSQPKISRQKAQEKIHESYEVVRLFSLLNLRNINMGSISREVMDRVIYECDVQNILSDVLGEVTYSLLDRYNDLFQEDKDFLIKLSKITTSEKRKIFVKENIGRIHYESIKSFLPSYCNWDLQIFDDSEVVKNSVSPVCLFSRKKIDESDRDNDFRKDIFSEFKLGEVISGVDIKSRLKVLYDKYYKGRKAKISDLFEYFEVSRAKQDGEWCYRIVLRKII